MTSYHNTNGESGETLVSSEKKAMRQEEAIIRYFYLRGSGVMLTAEEVHKHCGLHSDTPLTSVRRAITNLTKKGYLQQTGVRKPGSMGKMINTWELGVPMDKVKNLFTMMSHTSLFDKEYEKFHEPDELTPASNG